jgi:hexosaminidase
MHLIPDHTQSWGRGQPGLLTECYGDDGVLLVPDEYGALNPVREENYDFLQKFFEEVFYAFPEPYVHLGGDEVSFYCW